MLSWRSALRAPRRPPARTQPSLVLSAFLLLDTLLTVLPDEFGFHAWMFLVPSPAGGPGPHGARASSIDERAEAAAEGPPADAADAEASVAAPAAASGSSANAPGAAPGGRRGAAFEPYLARLVAMRGSGASAASRAAAGAAGVLPYATSPSADGRRRPLLALAHINDVAELAPYAAALDAHVHRNDISARGTVVDGEFVDALLGSHFVSRSAAERRLAGLRDPSLLSERTNGIVRIDSLYAAHNFSDDAAEPSAAACAPLSVDPTLAESSLLPLFGL